MTETDFIRKYINLAVSFDFLLVVDSSYNMTGFYFTGKLVLRWPVHPTSFKLEHVYLRHFSVKHHRTTNRHR